MKKMRFEIQMPEVTIYDLGNGKHDVVILTNKVETTELQDNAEPGEPNEVPVYEYDGNIFRTCKEISESDILANMAYYLNYEGDTEPTQEMIDYANAMIDEYTEQLIEEGAL